MRPARGDRGAERSPLWSGLELAAGCGVAFVLVSWLRSAVLASADAPALNDWVVFHRAAGRYFAEGAAGAYRESLREGYPFLYPPAALWFLAPLGGLAPRVFQLLFSAGSFAALALVGRLLWRAAPAAPPGLRRTALLLCAGSAALAVDLAVGQLGAWHLAAATLGTALWLSGRSSAAGLALALTAAKPTLGFAFPLLLAARRDLRALGGWCAGVALLLCSSLLVGREALGAWLESLAEMRALLEGGALQLGKQHTLRAAIDTHLAGAAPALRTALWLGLALPLGAAAIASWWRGSRRAPTLRLFGQAALLAVALSPYLFLYDAVLLALPFFAWATSPASYRSNAARRLLGVLYAVIFVEQYVVYLSGGAGPARLGIYVSLALAAELTGGMASARSAEPLDAQGDVRQT